MIQPPSRLPPPGVSPPGFELLWVWLGGGMSGVRSGLEGRSSSETRSKPPRFWGGGSLLAFLRLGGGACIVLGFCFVLFYFSAF